MRGGTTQWYKMCTMFKCSKLHSLSLWDSCANESAGLDVRLCACVCVYSRMVGRGGVKKKMTKDVIYVCSGFIPSSFYNEMSLGW